ncbi:MAG: MarR family winged helix-turn-helix transcriptional regulator [Lachnospiraceae bacterium]|nr:MarR family winged helix-turn-helix transcriptional regulator [Lachnospiraceae bacterium]
MDYYTLAREWMELRTDMPQMRENRQLSKMMQGEIYVLLYLAMNGNQAYPKDISARMSVSSARIAKILNCLEDSHVITRRKDPDNFRQTIVTLTDKGVEITRKHQQAILDRMAWMLELLGPDDAREYVRLQHKLTECFKKATFPAK